MACNVTKLAIRTREGNGDASLQQIGETARILRYQVRQDIGLLEGVMRLVENEREASLEIKIESFLVLEERRFYQGRDVSNQAYLVRLVVDIDVFRPEDFPVAPVVGDLVLAVEILGSE